MLRLTISSEYSKYIPNRYHDVILYASDYQGIYDSVIRILDFVSNKHSYICLETKLSIAQSCMMDLKLHPNFYENEYFTLQRVI